MTIEVVGNVRGAICRLGAILMERYYDLSLELLETLVPKLYHIS